jgi:hypothetical protein
MTEHVLTWHPKVPDTAAAEGQLRLLDMPTGLVRPRRQIQAAETCCAGSRRPRASRSASPCAS